MSPGEAPHDLGVERQIIGVLSISVEASLVLRKVLDTGLRPEHFFRAGHGEVFREIAATITRGETPDFALLTARLAGNPEVPNAGGLLAECGASQWEVVNAEGYAHLLCDLARRRTLLRAGQELTAAALHDDAEARDRGIALLASPDAHGHGGSKTAALLADEFVDRVSNQTEPEAFRFPWDALNRRTRGGLRRGQIMTIGGWSGIGKTVVYDQTMFAFSKQGRRVHSYINEMSDEERVERAIAALSRVPYSLIDSRSFTQNEQQARKVMDAAGEYSRHGVGITECAGWTADDIAQHVALNGWDVFGIDILHEIPHRDERDLASIAQTLRAAAKRMDAALVMTVHLNDQRVSTAQRPVPVARDIRGSGMIHRCSDIVLFVHRHDDENGVPGLDGLFKLDKLRRGAPGAFGVDFDPERMTYMVRTDDFAAIA